MAGYRPLYISGNETGLVQSRQEFLLPNDAYPTLENAFVWREQLKRRQGLQTLGRLRRSLTSEALGGTYSTINGINTFNIKTRLGLNANEPNAEIQIGSLTGITIVLSAPINQTLIDTFGLGTMGVIGAGPIISATINYSTGVVTVTANAAVGPSTLTFTGAYFPNLPVMGLRQRELNSINIEQLVAFDTIYAYIFITGSGWQEFIPGTIWTGTDYQFFWSTNYWVGDSNRKIFWVTNFSGPSGDPIRYTNGINWEDFAPQIDASGNLLNQCLAILPFRGRLVTFNTWEGLNLPASVNYPNRIRWAEIGNPFTTASSVVTTVVADAWRDDIRGKGGFLDIPTSENIVSVGFVRDNLVIYCERSTWQLRYTGRSIAPFQIEKVNSELGAESTFSAVQFDTSLVGVGDKGIVECDSYKSERIDIKIPDLVFQFNNENEGTSRVHGIRDFQQKLAYWIYPYGPIQEPDVNDVYPNRRLVYNYENDSWAIFTDSLTALGVYQPTISQKWEDFTEEPGDTWENSDFPWVSYQESFPAIVGGNQQGFVMYLSSNLQPQVTNDATLTIQDITFSTYTLITSPNHNLFTGQVIEILNIPSGTPYATSLNGNKYAVVTIDGDPNTFQIWEYDSDTQTFTIPVELSEGTYVGGGKICVRDGFSITSKKFNFLEEGQNIQLGFIDILMQATSNGAITLNTYIDYNDDSAVNQLGENNLPDTNPSEPDTFFNITVPTSSPNPSGLKSIKYWQRVFCPVRGAFITIEWTLSNAQLIGDEQENYVQIDSQILFIRKAGRQLPMGA